MYCTYVIIKRTNGFKESKQTNSLAFDGNMTVEFWKNCSKISRKRQKSIMKSKVSNIGEFTFANDRIT